MAITINAKGTSVSTFTVGKDGTSISQSGIITGPDGSDLVLSPASGQKVVFSNSGIEFPLTDGTDGQVLRTNGSGVLSFSTVAGTGTVTDVSVTTANGISGSVATSDTTPAITLTLGDITPNSVAATSTVSGSNLSGTNTGDQTITLTDDVTGSGTGSFAATLATVNANVGTFGSGSQVPVLVVDAKGRITGVTNTEILASTTNTVINGSMLIGQEATTITSPVTGRYLLDQWQYSFISSAVITSTQNTDSPASEFLYSLRAAVTTADASIAAGDFAMIQQPIEGFNVRRLIGKTFTVSFWVRSSKTGVHCVALCNSVSDRSYVAQYTVSVADTWEKKSFTVTGGLITAGTWNWTNGTGLQLVFTLATGTTFQTTAGTWQTGNFIGTSSQVNCLDTIGNIFAITGVQLEVGTTATEFNHRPIQTELGLCQRYFERGTWSYSGYHNGANQSASSAYFAVYKRAVPTVTGDTSLQAVNITGAVDAITPYVNSARFVITANAAGPAFAQGNFNSSARLT